MRAFCTFLLAAAPLLHVAPSFACDDDDCDELRDDDHDDGRHHHTGSGGSGGGVPGGPHIDETRPAKPTGVVEVHVFSGSIRVVGWAQNFVNVKGSTDHDCRLLVSPSGDRTEINVECPGGPSDADLEIKVPQGGAVEVRTMSAPVRVNGVAGAVRIHTVAADVSIDGTSAAEVEARSTSGSIDVRTNSAYTRAHTVSGNVTVNGAHGRASIHSVSGDCTLGGSDFTDVSMQSVSGGLDLTATLAGQANVEMQSHSGDVHVRVPATTNADVELRSFSGDLAIDVGSEHKEGEHSLQARLGTGGSKIRAHSFSGDVKVIASKK